MADETEPQELQQLQALEQNLQNFLTQKQSFQMQLMEVDSALRELEKVDTAYRIIGNILVEADKAALTEELKSKKEMADIRIRSIEKQEKNLREKAQELQKKVLGKLKSEKK
ncbi:prefoldin subunit beta [Candidatus Woesearchaeota archaeon]|nr:prefoldin subunit beta [Candidatus Woesearchaeota archaeon]